MNSRDSSTRLQSKLGRNDMLIHWNKGEVIRNASVHVYGLVFVVLSFCRQFSGIYPSSYVHNRLNPKSDT